MNGMGEGPTEATVLACALQGCGGKSFVLYRLRRFQIEQCSRCGMRFRRPFPTAEELHAMYENPDYLNAAYFASARGSASPEIQIYGQALHWLGAHVEGDARTLLDVGFGSGLFLRMARDAGWTAVGVEFSAAHAERAGREHGLDVRCGDFLTVPLAARTFDAVTMWDFLEHVLDPEAVLARAVTLLRPGGYIVIFTIDTSSLFNVLGHVLSKVAGRLAATPLELLYDARHNYYFTRRSLRSLLDRSGIRSMATSQHRAYLGRWLAEPAPWVIRVGGDLVDLASAAVGREYRQLLYCQPQPNHPDRQRVSDVEVRR
jgi:2-polyprenyl-3-methyl-5-hydroxy-6-metoxy-1,4-benzoquinol methylase